MSHYTLHAYTVARRGSELVLVPSVPSNNAQGVDDTCRSLLPACASSWFDECAAPRPAISGLFRRG